MTDDAITLAARVVHVLGVGDIMLSPQYPREPFHPDYSAAWQLMVLRLSRATIIHEIQAGKKWCSCCDTWRWKELFSPDARYRDGLHPHCKPCRAEHQRRLYALQKAENGHDVRVYRRRAA